jgi:hypothetical protein
MFIPDPDFPTVHVQAAGEGGVPLVKLQLPH